MRILYHHRTQGEEPESVHIAAIVGGFRALGHEVQVVGPTPTTRTGDGHKIPSLAGRIKRRVPRLVFEFLQLGYNAIIYRRLRRAIADFKPDLIYERYALFSFVGVIVAKKRKIPLILEVNTPYAQTWGQYFGLYLRNLASWTEKRTIFAADHVITVTHVQRDMLTQIGIPAHRITVCHNAIDPLWFDPIRHDGTRLRHELGLSGVVVGFVGTMNRWQGMTEFPTVLQKVISQSLNVSFLLVGDGEFRAQLENFCRAQRINDRVIFAGRRPHSDIPAFVAAMDIAVLLNSNHYGSPMKIFEYLGMGKAVVAPAVTPVMEVLRDGETGLLISPGSASEMAAKIIRLVGDPVLRTNLGMAGRAYVLTNHTWRQNTLKVMDAYSGIMRQRSDKIT